MMKWNKNLVNRIDTFSIKDFLKEQARLLEAKIIRKKKVDYLEVFKNKINLKQDFNFKKYLKIRKKINK